MLLLCHTFFFISNLTNSLNKNDLLFFFQRVFSRVEAVDEVCNQVERTLGQTQDLEHHWHTFCRYLDLLPRAVPGTPNRLSGAHLQQWHWSLSPGVPEGLVGYHSLHKLAMDRHAKRPFATVQESYDFCKPENKALADAASRPFGHSTARAFD